MVITPTVGRKVWYHPSESHPEMNTLSDQPLDATVVFVHDARCINLFIIDHLGHSHFVEKATLKQPEDPLQLGVAFAAWMPYQVDQVRKETAYQNSKVPPPATQK